MEGVKMVRFKKTCFGSETVSQVTGFKWPLLLIIQLERFMQSTERVEDGK
jgi:hypothetical protein